jgi:hypothetical protein
MCIVQNWVALQREARSNWGVGSAGWIAKVAKAVGWVESEIEDWILLRIQSSRGNARV